MKSNRVDQFTSMPFQNISLGKLQKSNNQNKYDFNKTQRNYNVSHYRDYLDYQKNLKEKTSRLDKLKEKYMELQMLQKMENNQVKRRVIGTVQNFPTLKTSQSCYFQNQRPHLHRDRVGNTKSDGKIGLSQTTTYNFRRPVFEKNPPKLHGSSYDPFVADRLKKRKKQFEHYIEKGFSTDLQNQLERILRSKLEGLGNSVWDRQLVIDRNLDSLDLYVNSLKEQNDHLKCNIQGLLRELQEHELYGEMEMKVFLKKFLLFQRSKNKTDLFYLLWDKLQKRENGDSHSKYIFPSKVYTTSKTYILIFYSNKRQRIRSRTFKVISEEGFV